MSHKFTSTITAAALIFYLAGCGGPNLAVVDAYLDAYEVELVALEEGYGSGSPTLSQMKKLVDAGEKLGEQEKLTEEAGLKYRNTWSGAQKERYSNLSDRKDIILVKMMEPQ